MVICKDIMKICSLVLLTFISNIVLCVEPSGLFFKKCFNVKQNDLYIFLEDEKDGRLKHTLPHFPKEMPRKIKKTVGELLELKCKAEGVPEPNVQWYKNDIILKQTTPIFTIEKVDINDNGLYNCTVCNVKGCISHEYEVKIFGM